jgi:hypothetical protein
MRDLVWGSGQGQAQGKGRSRLSSLLTSPSLTSHYESLETSVRVALQHLDQNTAKELGVKGKYKIAFVLAFPKFINCWNNCHLRVM